MDKTAIVAKIYRAQLLLACAAQVACAPASNDVHKAMVEQAPAATNSRLWLSKEGQSGGVVRLARSSSGAASDPRMIELWLKTANISGIVESEPGEALTHAGKALTVQDKGNGLFRVLAFSSSNVTPIGAGELATLELEREHDGPMRVEILTDRPMFAPQETQQGLMVGDPIEL